MEPSRSLQLINTTGRRIVTRFGDIASHREQWQMILFVVVAGGLLIWLLDITKGQASGVELSKALEYAVPLIIYSVTLLSVGFVMSWRRMSEQGEVKIIAIDELGIKLGTKKFEETNAVTISWQNLEAVEVIDEANKKDGNQSFVYISTYDVHIFKLKWDNAFAWVEPETFFLNLRTKAPDAQVNYAPKEIAEVSNKDERYTNLWLQYFSSPGSRERKGALEPGTLLNNGQYSVLHRMGGGGQGTVYLAEARTVDTHDSYGEAPDFSGSYDYNAANLSSDDYAPTYVAQPYKPSDSETSKEYAEGRSSKPGTEADSDPAASARGYASGRDYERGGASDRKLHEDEFSMRSHRAHERGDKLVVLKEYILPIHRSAMLEEKHYELLNSEAEILSRINHPHIVRMLDCFVEDHRGYLVLEYVNGDSFRSLVSSAGPLPEAAVKEVALSICDILSYLHNTFRPPIVHRDLTPDNLLCDQNGVIKLIDFTIARQFESQRSATVAGKQAYIPPEQFRGFPGPESDIYALGCTMFFLLTGSDPEPMKQSHPKEVVAEVTAGMDEVVATTTALDTKDRYSSAEQLKAALLHLS